MKKKKNKYLWVCEGGEVFLHDSTTHPVWLEKGFARQIFDLENLTEQGVAAWEKIPTAKEYLRSTSQRLDMGW